MKSKVNRTKRKSSIKKLYRTEKNNNKNTVTKEPKKLKTNNTKKLKKYQKGSGPGNNASINENSYEPDKLLPIIAAQLSSIIYSNHHYILFIINLIGISISTDNYGIFEKNEQGDYEIFNNQLLQLAPKLFIEFLTLPKSIDFFDVYINPKSMLNNKLMVISLIIKEKKYLFIVSKGTNSKTNVLYDLKISTMEGNNVRSASSDVDLNPDALRSLFEEPKGETQGNIAMAPLSVDIIKTNTNIKYHKGFLLYYRDVADFIYSKLESIGDELKTYEKIIFTGHSLGGAIASITAIHMYPILFQYLGDSIKEKVYVYTFGCPKYVANNSLQQLNKLDDIYPREKVINYINKKDIMHKMPPYFARYGTDINNNVNIPKYISADKSKIKKIPALLHHGYYLGLLIGGLHLSSEEHLSSEKLEQRKILKYSSHIEEPPVLVNYSIENSRPSSASSYSSASSSRSQSPTIDETSLGGGIH